ncbi:MAG: hypothetical protein ABW168_14500 [Sedimenticola sp.]
MEKIALLSALTLAASDPLMAGGYKLPENSINGTALSAANIANAHGTDASYYNPVLNLTVSWPSNRPRGQKNAAP